MDNHEVLKAIVKMLRKQGKSANDSRKLAGEAVRCMRQGEAWKARSDKKQEQYQRLINKIIKDVTADGVKMLTVPEKKGKPAKRDRQCRVTSRAKTASNGLWMRVAQGKRRDKSISRGQVTSDALAVTVTITKDVAPKARHARYVKMVDARRYAKRQVARAMLYALRTTPDKLQVVWHMQDWTTDYPERQYPLLARVAAYNATLSTAVPYNHAAFLAFNAKLS